MSLALLKNLLFAADRKRRFPAPDFVPNPTTHNVASASHSNLPPTPPSSQNHSPKDSEISWLSSESSSCVNPSSSDTPPAPVPFNNNNNVNNNSSNSNSNSNNSNNKSSNNNSSINDKQELTNVVSVPNSSSSDNDQLPEEKNSNVESDEMSESDLEGQKQKKRRVSPRMISDAIIGISDGMTVPFALTAGLAYLGDTKVVVLGGLAELIAGALSMGLGGFIGAKSEAESYHATVLATEKLIATSPTQTSALIRSVLRPYSLPPQSIQPLLLTLQQSSSSTLDFLMRFHHQTPSPDSSRPFICAITISLGYFLGGLVPLIPYFCVPRSQVYVALYWSIGVMAVALFVFGWVKTGVVSGWRGKENVWAGLKGALQMVMIGGAAAGAAVGLVRAIGH